MLDLHAHHAPIRAELSAAIESVVDSGQFILGPALDLFEQELAEHLGVAHVVGVSSGTDALICALMAMGIGPGDEVITTPCSFVATAEAIMRVGAIPVFADIDPGSFNLSPGAAEESITANTRAIIPVNLFGRQAEMPLVRVPVLEDSAQSIGAPLHGLAGTLSFFPSKNLGACGDAGAIYTDSHELAAACRLRRNHGTAKRYHYSVIGGNLRMDTLQAAILRVKLPHLERWTADRRANAEAYRERLQESPVVLPTDAPGHAWNQFVIRAPRRDELRAHLASAGISTEVYYPVPLHLQPCFADLGYQRGEFPEAERAAAEVLGLPVYPELPPDSLEYVAESIRAFYS
ncbi:MAG: DegT/DnrJ/EryC1/StrS family aminotransferase [Gemmatimonadaceae bacterium]|jgi:dTDP-4-amino-4,6-dideoxygalactose transaminase